MRQTNTRTAVEQKPLGVIDVVSAGLSLVWRRPWTLVIPILLDAMIWLLPRLSLTPLIIQYQTLFTNPFFLSTEPPDEQVTLQMQEFINSFNLVGLLSGILHAITRLPALLSVTAFGVANPIDALRSSIPIQSPEFALLLLIPLILLGLLAVAAYFESIAQGVRPLSSAAPGTGLLRIAKLWLNLIWFSLVILALFLVSAFAVWGVYSISGSAELVGFAMLLLSVGLFWLFIYFFFVPGVMSISAVGFGEAMRRSTLLFRIFFLPTIALVALTVFLEQGMLVIWDGLTVSTFGVALGIVGNAFIGTALIAASMVYYQDRINLFERLRAGLKPVKKLEK